MVGSNTERPYLESPENLSPAYRKKRFRDLSGPSGSEETILFLGYDGLFFQAYKWGCSIRDGSMAIPQANAVVCVPHDDEVAQEFGRLFALGLGVRMISRSLARMYPHNLMAAMPVLNRTSGEELVELIGLRKDMMSLGMIAPEETIPFICVVDDHWMKEFDLLNKVSHMLSIYRRNPTYRVECIWEQ